MVKPSTSALRRSSAIGWTRRTSGSPIAACPLNIANAHGWEILCGAGFTAIWNGGWAMDAIDIRPDPGTKAPVSSHFAHGVLTFHVPCVFRTEPGFDLIVQGPINRPKDGISPLSAVIETDWAPYTFTMNWVFTHPGMPVRFDEGEPFCHLFPIRRGELEAVTPQTAFDLGGAGTRAPIQGVAGEPLPVQCRPEDARLAGAKGAVAEEVLSGRRFRSALRAVDDHRTRLRLKPFQR